MRRPFVPPFAAIACLALGGCGVNLLVQHVAGNLHDSQGRAIPVTLHWQVERGFLGNEDQPVHGPLVGLLLEPIDWVMSTVTAARALVRSDLSVSGGPIGWFAAMTPFATLIPELDLGPRRSATVDDATLERLRQGDVDTARQVFGHAIRGVTFP